ncbi:hypothetical protein PPL_04073 [Heterostelium album PN500]|uniref:Cytochrome P450 n=1 Tax=Heterostelium pallidum (strain ATCC 26659 / Pp 5 / PN500) TaxID=670386 RepID=D3B5Y5_HETP5|nr:hypothetical protein PPL_04073 [Heterostelium album PN500]EFA83283.1 hypothetical protein PPL_04073 [Heterostelium album PN500]|eukprot:XP_020435400.1 hypothetical protein PPL_04073 [Heterostelium album PN500]
MYEVHFNKEIYENPEEFNPERYMVEDHKQEWMPFSLGPRNCVGMNLGLDKVYVGAANLLLNYHFKPHNCDKYEYNDTFGLTLRADKDYPLTITLRSEMDNK